MINNAASTIDVTGSNTLTISTSITGSGTLNKTDSGTLNIGGGVSDTTANTFSSMVVSAGIVNFNKAVGTVAMQGNSSKSITDLLINGGTVTFARNHQLDGGSNTGGTVNVNMTSGTLNIGATTQSLYDFTNSGGHLLSSRGSHLIIIDPTWSGGTNDVSPGSTFTFANLTISGGTNTIHGDENGAGGGFGGVLQLGLTVNSGTVMTFSGNSSPNLTINSDTNTNTAGLLILDGNVSFTGTAGTAGITNGLSNAQPGIIDFDGQARTFTIGSGTGTQLVSGATKTDMQITAQITNSTGYGYDTNVNDPNSLVKAGAGTLALFANNLYSGGTTINGGILQINQDTSLGATSGLTVINAGTLELTTASLATSRSFQLGSTSSAIYVDSGLSYTINSTIADNGGNVGTLNVTGPGTLQLFATNSYSGGSVLSGGVTQINTDASLGNSSGSVTINAATLQVSPASSSITTSPPSRWATCAAAISVDSGTTYTITGQVGGSGSLNASGLGTLVLTNASNNYTVPPTFPMVRSA